MVVYWASEVAFDHGLIAYKGCIVRQQADILEYSIYSIGYIWTE